MNTPLIAFIGDDFTGSTDAMESLARHGLRTVLFTDPPTPDQLHAFPGLRAYGIAGLTRSLPADQIDAAIRPLFVAARACGAPIIHYKTCSTFDSSPAIGSIGRVIDIGMDEFSTSLTPVIVGAPALGRYCVYGNLFARCGSDPEIYRLDRHPSMSRHPVTPMAEADLRRHLARQTTKPIGLLNVTDLESSPTFSQRTEPLLLIDLLQDRHLPIIGKLLADYAATTPPLFVVGSSGVESCLCAHWQQAGITRGLVDFPPPRYAGPIIAVCGSCSPVTAKQVQWACSHGFIETRPDDPLDKTIQAIRDKKSVCLHTGGLASEGGATLGIKLGLILRQILAAAPIRRAAIAGGDTASHIARALGIQSVEMIAALTRGAPLCRAGAPGSPADGLEITFKGGQIGADDFFALVEGA